LEHLDLDPDLDLDLFQEMGYELEQALDESNDMMQALEQAKRTIQKADSKWDRQSTAREWVSEEYLVTPENGDAKQLEASQVRISELELALQEAQAQGFGTGFKSRTLRSSEVVTNTPEGSEKEAAKVTVAQETETRNVTGRNRESDSAITERDSSKARESKLLNEIRELQEKGHADAKQLEASQIRISELALAFKEAQAQGLGTAAEDASSIIG